MNISRRTFLRNSLAGLSGAAFAAGCSLPKGSQERQVMTVAGPMAATAMGPTLPHEHILVDFIGAAQIRRERYNSDEVFQTALPHLQRIRSLGCRTLIDCTPAYIGRDPLLLRRLSAASGVTILTNTGYYGASQNKYLPAHAFQESAAQLSDRWIREWQNGIEDSGVRPGFMKIGVDAGKLSDVHRKLVQAAAQTHLATGLTIAIHTGNGIAALDELQVIENAGVKGNAFIWVHAQNESNPEVHAQVARRGGWVEFDGISPTSIEQHVRLVTALKDRGFLNRILISQDAGWYHVGEPKGGNFRSFETVFTEFLPALRKAGFGEDEIRQLIEINPREAFTIQIRKA